MKIDVKGPWFIHPEGRGWILMVSESGDSSLDKRVLMVICCLVNSVDEKKSPRRHPLYILLPSQSPPHTYIR